MSPLLCTALVTLTWCVPTTNAIDCIPSTRYSHPLNCSKFIMCDIAGNPREFDCPAGLHFNGDIMASYCDWPENVNCTQQVDLLDYYPINDLLLNLQSTNSSSTSSNESNISKQVVNQTEYEINATELVVLNNTNQINDKNATTVKKELVVLNQTKPEEDKNTTSDGKTDMENISSEATNKTSNISESEDLSKNETKIDTSLLKSEKKEDIVSTQDKTTQSSVVNKSEVTNHSVSRRQANAENKFMESEKKNEKTKKEEYIMKSKDLNEENKEDGSMTKDVLVTQHVEMKEGGKLEIGGEEIIAEAENGRKTEVPLKYKKILILPVKIQLIKSNKTKEGNSSVDKQSVYNKKFLIHNLSNTYLESNLNSTENSGDNIHYPMFTLV